ncbi:MAG: hypothetical protein AAF618_07560 [Pseudomonadota bacterium]
MTQDDRRRSRTGQLISTLCYLGMGLWLIGEALGAPPLQGALIGLAGLASLAGAARHTIARLTRQTGALGRFRR